MIAVQLHNLPVHQERTHVERTRPYEYYSADPYYLRVNYLILREVQSSTYGLSHRIHPEETRLFD